MGIGGLMAGTQVEVVSVEDDPSGDLRVYLTHRSMDAYVRIQSAKAKREVCEAWGDSHGVSRLLIPTPSRECVIWPADPEHVPVGSASEEQ